MTNVTVNNLVKKWVEDSLSLVSTFSPQGIHIDDLLQSHLPEGSAEKVDIAISCYNTTLIHLSDRRRSIKLMLVWPLECASSLDTRPPSQLEWGFEPPSLYLIDRMADQFFEPNEEFIYPIINNIPSIPIHKDSKVYYRCFRSLEGMLNSWEYDRCLYIVDYPDELTFGHSLKKPSD